MERLRANMTQSALSDGRVSRNMLSMIESGAASPSVETLEHIANTLDVPAGIFFTSDESDEALYEKVNDISKAKALYTEKRYEDCAEICRKHPHDDEMNYLLAESMIAEAEKNMSLFMLTSASNCLKKAASASKRCKYMPKEFAGTVEAYEAIISFATGEISVDTVNRLARTPSRVPASVFAFLLVLSYFDRGDAESAEKIAAALPFLSKEHVKYVKAMQLAREFKFNQAIELFEELSESDDLQFISKYRLMANIESCYENKRDFESAYKYSTMKHHILELYSK